MFMDKRKYNVFWAIWFPVKYCPGIAFLIALFDICLGIIPTLQTLAVAKFIDGAMELVRGKTKYVNVLFWIVVLVILIAFVWLSKNFKDLFMAKLEIELRQTFRTKITEKRQRLKYFYIEDAKTWDLISRISDKPETRVKEAYINFLDFIALIIQIVGLILVFASQVWQISIIMIILVIPLFIISLKNGKANYETKKETQKYHRRQEYLGDILINREAAQERVLFNFGEGLSKMWHRFYEKARKMELITQRNWFIRSKLGGVLTTTISIIASLFLIQPVLAGVISTGMFISCINSIYALVDAVVWSLASYVEKVADFREYMKDYTIFDQLEEQEDVLLNKEEKIYFESLEFRDVYFQYPNTEKYILNGFSYKFVRGVSYALIGINGAGKSTLVKLMIGLYDNYTGEILLNGKNIREYNIESVKQIFSIVFQDFVRYSISIEDNILIGSLSQSKDKTNNKIDEVIHAIGLDELAAQYKEGLKTKLGKIYKSGKDISGGQWQRIALARAMMRDGQVCILDEPTSALDPISESNLYKEFKNISIGKTMLLISHRLGSTSIADTILVLSEGRLLEVGSHDVLMEKQGMYANMYENQRSWYGE